MSASTIHLFVASGIYGILGLLGVLPALFSVTMFDAPGSERNPATRLLFWSICTFPAVCLLAVVLAWVLYLGWAHAAANVLVHLPLVNLALILVGAVWLEKVYGGRFSE